MIRNYLKAGYPGLYIVTQDIYRAQRKIPEDIADLQLRVVFWDCVHGIHDKNFQQIEEIQDPVEAINYLGNQRDTLAGRSGDLFRGV